MYPSRDRGPPGRRRMRSAHRVAYLRRSGSGCKTDPIGARCVGARMQVTCRKVLDQSKSNSVGVLFDAAGRVDILVKNASAIPGDDLQRFDTTRWRAAGHVKVFG